MTAKKTHCVESINSVDDSIGTTLSATPLNDVVTRPILFSGPMVRALLDGRKTQTRRIVKDQDLIEFDESNGEFLFAHSKKCPNFCDYACGGLVCPYGQVGDRLWVRETWCHAADENDQFVYNAEGNLDSSCCHYRADGKEVRHAEGGDRSPWVPSIHMPRWASRLTLEVTKVRIERLNDITGDDARAEGCPDNYVEGAEKASMDFMSAGWFAELWESINGEGSWAQNPWVWVVEFKVV